jgi:hypothetical protein
MRGDSSPMSFAPNLHHQHALAGEQGADEGTGCDLGPKECKPRVRRTAHSNEGESRAMFGMTVSSNVQSHGVEPPSPTPGGLRFLEGLDQRTAPGD